MTHIQFYHLTTSPLERALPRLLEKIVAGGFRVALTVSDDAQAEKLDDLLWTYDPGSFLAHGRAGKGNEEAQPILITSQETSSSPVSGEAKSLLFITDGRLAEENFERVVDMFDGKNELSLASARQRWKHYKDSGHTVTYFRQTDSGGWENRMTDNG